MTTARPARGLGADLLFAVAVVGSLVLALTTGATGTTGDGTSGGSGRGGSAGTSGGSSTTGSTEAQPEQQPAPASPAPVPPPGTRVEATVDTLPPYLPAECLAGKVRGLELASGDRTQVRRACARVRVEAAPRQAPLIGSGGDVDVRLSVVVEAQPQGPPVVVVRQQPDTGQRTLATLLAALLVVVVAAGTALALRRGRP